MRFDRRIAAALGLAVLLSATGLGLWMWGTPDDAPVVERRVGQDRRPNWARRFSVRPPLPAAPDVSPPPASVLRSDPASADEAQLDESDAEPEDGVAHLIGWLVDSDGAQVGRGMARVRCSTLDDAAQTTGGNAYTGRARVDRSGYFELRVPAPADCTVSGARPDGLLSAFATPDRFLVESGEEIEFDLIVPASRTGGIGVAIAEHEEGVLIQRVHRGTPAYRAGLRDGDIIVGVDGEGTTGLDLNDFIARTTGAEGTDVEVVVRTADGREETHVIERQFLDRSLLR
ncbi:MAG: S41 family peptidase [Myxococcota bacterium]